MNLANCVMNIFNDLKNFRGKPPNVALDFLNGELQCFLIRLGSNAWKVGS